jgi:hypothetical protein
VCEHVLYFENLKNEFPELMEAHNMSDVKLMDSVNEMYIQKLRCPYAPPPKLILTIALHCKTLEKQLQKSICNTHGTHAPHSKHSR